MKAKTTETEPHFEVSIDASDCIWSEALKGSERVAAALSRALRAAATGREGAFVVEMHEIADAMEDWYGDLFGQEV